MKKSTSKLSKKSAAAQARATDFDFALVQQISAFMKEQGIVELEVRSGLQEIRLRRGEAYSGNFVASPPSAAVSAAPAGGSSAPAPVAEAPSNKKDYHVITSPFVGTFYRSAGPNQDPFVEVGQVVSSGDSLCIVEAMKLMNEIECDAKGRVVSVLIEDGTPVEFGEPLFEIETV